MLPDDVRECPYCGTPLSWSSECDCPDTYLVPLQRRSRYQRWLRIPHMTACNYRLMRRLCTPPEWRIITAWWSLWLAWAGLR